MNQQNQEKEKEIVYIEREKIVYVVKEESELSKTVDSTIKGTLSIGLKFYYFVLSVIISIIFFSIAIGYTNIAHAIFSDIFRYYK